MLGGRIIDDAKRIPTIWTRGGKWSCNDKREAVFKIRKQCFLSRQKETGQRSGWEVVASVTYLRSSLAFCTAANAAALSFEASRPEGRAQTRHIGQLAG